MDTPPTNVFAWLDRVRQRPGMYFVDLADLERLVDGYQTALSVHNLVEPGPQMLHFGEWLYDRTGWSTNCGWARAIKDHTRRSLDPADTFFTLLDVFRQLQPTPIAWVALDGRHRPTGKRLGPFSIRIERPKRIDIIRYRPTRLHFLRFHYGRRIVNNHLLYTGDGSHQIRLSFAKRWVADEFQVADSAWHASR